MTTCGIGGWGGPLPGDPSNDIVLLATSAYGGVDLNWSYPTTNPHAVAYVAVFRGTSAVFANAILVKEVTGSYYFDKLAVSAVYYYWIRVVSYNGTVSPVVGPVSALSKLTITGLIEELTGVIDEGLLAGTLSGKIAQISTLNTNLAQEVLDRQGGETSLSAAIAAVELDIAEAHTFILAETNSRVSANTAIVEQINGVVATLGGDLAAATLSLTADIDAVSGTVDAMVVAKVTVNGLVGGFGVWNDGVGVEAGFDVDTFWVGRTGADKMKPFIISDGIVYIKEAVIPILTADKIDTRNLTIKDGAGNVIFSAGDSLDYNRINASTGWLNSNITVNGGVLTGTGTNGVVVDNSLVGGVNLVPFEQSQISVPPGQYGATAYPLTPAMLAAMGLRVGDVITFSADIWQDATSAAAGNTVIAHVYATSTWGMVATAGNTAATTPTRLSGSAVINAAALSEGLTFGVWHQPGNTAYAGTGYMTRVQLERGPVATPYKTGYYPGATVGAQAGVNLLDSGGVALGDAAIKNSVLTPSIAAAQDAANAANNALANIASDAILSPGEKPQVKLDYDALIDFFLLDRCQQQTHGAQTLDILGPHGGLHVFGDLFFEGE